MLLVKSKRIRQPGAIPETGNFLSLKLLLKNPSMAPLSKPSVSGLHVFGAHREMGVTQIR